MSTDFTRQIETEISGLDPTSQRRVLDYVRSLKKTGAGMPSSVLMQHIGCIDAADGREMRDAIESGCEQVNTDEW